MDGDIDRKHGKSIHKIELQSPSGWGVDGTMVDDTRNNEPFLSSRKFLSAGQEVPGSNNKRETSGNYNEPCARENREGVSEKMLCWMELSSSSGAGLFGCGGGWRAIQN